MKILKINKTEMISRYSKKLVLLGFMTISYGIATSAIWDPYCTIRRPSTAGYGCKDRLNIENISIKQGANVVYYKEADGCSGPANVNPLTNSAEYGKVVNSESNPVMLSAGATYSIGITSSGNTVADNGYAGLWIDMDYNNSFVDAGELLNSSPTSWPVTSPKTTPGAYSYISFTIPCSVKQGLTRIRISLDKYSGAVTQAKGCVLVPNTPSAYPWYGETEDLYIYIAKSTKLAVDFIVPADIYVNSPVKFVNKNTVGFISHDWDRDIDGYDLSSTDYSTEYATPGSYSVKLRSENCYGIDSVTKTFNVIVPSAVPTIDFIANTTTVDVGDELTLYDISGNGPTSWDWQLNNPIQSLYDLTNVDGTAKGYLGKTNIISFMMNNLGKFDVCLTATNGQGFASKCKPSYITVQTPSKIFLGIGDNSTQLPTGTVYDRGGPANNYSTGALGKPSSNSLLIQPCGATEIALNVTQLKLADKAHGLRVWDGTSSNGKPLHPAGGFNMINSSTPFTIKATSGAMYIELNTSVGVVADSGLIATFTTVLGTPSAPSPSFDFFIPEQNQAFTNAITMFHSTSGNLSGIPSYGWYIDGVAVPPSNLTDGGKTLNYEFTTPGTYDVCMMVITCAGDSMVCKSVTVKNPTGTAILKIGADNVRPQVNEVVSLSGMSNIASKFRWEIVPLTYQVVPPYTLNSKDLKVKFTASGAYNIRLVGWNTLDSAGTIRSVVNDSFIKAVDYCSVTSNVVTEDVGNNLLKITDASNTVIFNQPSSTGTTAYQNFTSDEFEVINLFAGGHYNLFMSRETNYNRVSRAAYVDWDGNGLFADDERIAYSYNSESKEFLADFQVPDVSKLVLGKVRMRVITSHSTLPFSPCQDLSAGEIEDYNVKLISSDHVPVINLAGDNIIYVALGGTFVDSGYSASDFVEGDITYRVVKTTNIDVNTIGMYYVRYNAVNASNIAALQKERIVIVMKDNDPPVITILGANPDYLEAGNGAYVDPGATAMDNLDGNVTNLIVVNGAVDHTHLGNYTINYSVFDASGNFASSDRVVTVEDKTKPEIHFIGGTNIALGSVWTDMTYATDNYWSGKDLVLEKTYGFNGPVNQNVKGSYTVTYKATDGSGNSTTDTRTYIVGDFTAPVILLNTEDTIYHDVNNPYNSINPTIYDDQTNYSNLSIFKSGTVNPYKIGTYTELFRVIDDAGNQTEVTRTVVVLDRIAPSIVTPYICTPQFNVYNNKIGVIVEDNYYSSAELMPLVEVIYSDVNIFIEGIYKNLYVVTDPSGNRSEEVWRVVEVNKNCEVLSSVSSIGDNAHVTVYPNPSNGIFEINLDKLSNKVESIEIINSVGERIMNIDNNNIQKLISVDLSGFATGVYSVKISGKDINIVKRIIIVK